MPALAWGADSKFPERPIVLIDPASPGSSTEFFLRPLAEELAKLAHQPVLVEHKPGAGGALAAEFVAKAKPDGYTLGLAAVSTHVTNPILNPAARYDPILDFEPISMMVTVPSVTFVRADSPFQSLNDLAEAARREPGAISFASPGVGTAGHILLEQFASIAKVRFLHVPYRGSTGMFNDILGGQLRVASDNIPAVLPHLQSGRLRALAIRDTRRSVKLPGIATFAEQGFEAVSYPLWFGLVAPARTRPEVIFELNRLVHAAMNTPAFQERVAQGAATHTPGTPEQFKSEITQWLERFRRIVESANIKLQ